MTMYSTMSWDDDEQNRLSWKWIGAFWMATPDQVVSLRRLVDQRFGGDDLFNSRYQYSFASTL